MAEETTIPSKEKDEMDNVPDGNPTTFINENLWKKFFFKLIAYIVYVVGNSIAVTALLSIEWTWATFVIGLQTIILPLVWSTLDAQARNNEIQAKLIKDQELKTAKESWEKDLVKNAKLVDDLKNKVMNQRIEIAEAKVLLDAKCTELAANKNATEVAKTL